MSTELKTLYRVTSAELLVHHTITNNPNDQVRPEDFENESAIGTLPTYTVIENYNGEAGRTVWASTDDYYAGDGTLYAAGTILRDTMLAEAVEGSIPDIIGAMSEDLELGFTNAWYTTMDREPFEPDLTADGLGYDIGPRWRLQPDKYGQDLPSVVIPLDPSAPLPTTKDNQKYEVGAETQTVLNLLDWASPISPLELSAGWQNNSGTVSINGLNMTDNFDVAFYIKGDVKPATIYSTELVMDYEEIAVQAADITITGTEGSDFLVGIGNNTFTGGGGEDLFVLSYGTSVTDVVTANVVTDFEIGTDKLGLIGFDALAGFDVDLLESRALITQGVSGNDLTVSVDGDLVATLTGVAASLDVGTSIEAGEGLNLLDSFMITNPGAGIDPADNPVDPDPDPEPDPEPTVVTGTAGDDILNDTDGDDILFGLAGNDYLYGSAGDDTLSGGEGQDRLYGGTGEDTFVFADETGMDIVYDFVAGTDQILLDGMTFDDLSITEYRGRSTLVEFGDDLMILRKVEVADLTADNFITDDGMMLA